MGQYINLYKNFKIIMTQKIGLKATYHADPDNPDVYMAQSKTPMSLRAQKTPLRETIARNPPPEPRTATDGT